MQCSAPVGTSPDIQAQCEIPVHTSLQWQPAECIVFAASMAKQVAQRLNPHEALVDGVVARLVADLSRLAAGTEDPGEAGSCEHEQWTSAYEYWWPVWWCPYQPASEPTFQAAEPAAGAGLGFVAEESSLKVACGAASSTTAGHTGGAAGTAAVAVQQDVGAVQDKVVCPLSSQRPDTGTAAASSTAAGEPTTGSMVGMGGLEHAEGTADPGGRTRRTKTIRRHGKKKKAARGCAVVHAPESEAEQDEGSEPSSGQGEQHSFRWDCCQCRGGGRRSRPHQQPPSPRRWCVLSVLRVRPVA